MFSKYNLTINNHDVECPYCEHKYQLESEDYSEDKVTEECEDCGKKFKRYVCFSTDVRAEPDCLINGEQHDPETDKNGYISCKTCDAYIGREKQDV